MASKTFTVSSVSGAGSKTSDQTGFGSDELIITRITAAPVQAGDSWKIQLFQKDTYATADLAYDSGTVTGNHDDPREDDAGVYTARTEDNLPVCLYEDEDATTELHVKITNNDAGVRDFTVTVHYREPMYLSAGVYAQALKVSSVGPHSIGTGTPVDYAQLLLAGSFVSGGAVATAVGLRISTDLTGASGDTTFQSLLAAGGTVGASITTGGGAETITDISTAQFYEPDVTLGSGDSATNTYTVIIKNAPTEGSNSGALLVDSGDVRIDDKLAVGAAAPSGQLHVDQNSATGAIPVLYLDQGDDSEEMIEFAGTIGVGNAIEAVGAKVLTTTHFIKVTLPGALTRYLPVGTIA